MGGSQVVTAGRQLVLVHLMVQLMVQLVLASNNVTIGSYNVHIRERREMTLLEGSTPRGHFNASLFFRPHLPTELQPTQQGSVVVVASRQVVPGTTYHVAVQNLQTPGEPFMSITATLTADRHQVTSATAKLNPGDLSNLLLQVTSTSTRRESNLLLQ
ncbi:uncharacterized protein LOC125178333, partial [Hyalella azteca]|uniref:Uncharacterized protein LOC125178333 n=1 Tax=Hyalella azteca TaxID=294128 RepID=A0A979FL93_HYAAZ